MAVRITIMLDDDINKKLRIKHASLVKKADNAVSFSKVLNDTLRNCLSK